MRAILRIAGTTALEGLQQPVALLLTLTACAITGLGPLVHLFSFGEEGRLARDSGLAALMVLGLVSVAFTASATIYDELRRGTASAVLAKPVSRAQFLLGKWLGVASCVLLFSLTVTLSTLLAERTAEHFVETDVFLGSCVDKYTGLGSLAALAAALLLAAALNYAKEVRFGRAALLFLPAGQLLVLLLCGFVDRTGASPAGGYALQINARVLPAAALVTLLLLVYTAVATALSTRLRAAPVVLSLVGLLFFGFLAERLFIAGSIPVLRPLYLLVPDVQNFWRTDAVANGGAIPLSYLFLSVLSAACGIAFWLLLGIASLSRKDVG